MWKLYTRPGCHLCEDALEWLQDLAAEHHAIIQEINILDDFDIYEQYKWRIPVLQIDDQLWDAPLEERQIRQTLLETDR